MLKFIKNVEIRAIHRRLNVPFQRTSWRQISKHQAGELFWICAAGLTCALVAETCWPLTKVRSLCFCSTFFAFLRRQMWFLVTKCSSSAESLKAAAVLSKSTFFPKNSREIPTHSHKSGEHKDSTKDWARVSSTKMGINIPPDQLALCHFCLRAPFSL